MIRPTAYELAVIIRDGMQRMYEKMENIFYYITLMNETYTHPAIPKGVEEGIIKGMYSLKNELENLKSKFNYWEAAPFLGKLKKLQTCLTRIGVSNRISGVLPVLMK